MAALFLVAVWCTALSMARPRHSLFFLAASALIVLPIASLVGQRGKMTVACLCVALVLALSPLDYMIDKTGRWSVRLLPVSHGIVCKPDTACYGCVMFGGEPKYTVVLGY
jgi:hypothetical protein